jgi:trimethylamine monooxygenase
MGQYMKDLMNFAGYTGYKIDDVIQLYNELQRHKENDILTFRDNIYRSAVTGEMSIMKGIKWLEAGSRFENGEDPEND